MDVVSLVVAHADFQRAAELCIQRSERTYPQFLNGQGYRLATFAMRETARADAGKIAVTLGQVSTRIRNKRTGGLLKSSFAKTQRQFTSKASLDLYRIINWRRARTGKKPIGGKAMSKPARRMRSAALRSTAFIAAGWVYAIKGLAKAVGYAEFKDSKPTGARMTGKAKGWVNPAKLAFNSVVKCEIGNTSLLAQSASRTGSRKGNPMPIAQRGLTLAYQLTRKDMLEHLAKKIAPVLKQSSAR